MKDYFHRHRCQGCIIRRGKGELYFVPRHGLGWYQGFERQLLRMVTDVQLAIFANMLGVSLFLLVVLYHYVAVNNPKKQE
ncbi:UNVERIFIED_CONTAM: hypothetical protein K2H54_032574 [Gekko kuhli]